MIAARVRWTETDRFVGSASSGHGVVLDAGKEDKIGSSPMELVLIGLCGCTASDVAGILRTKREPFTGLEVAAEGDRAPEPPSVFTAIRLVYRVYGAVSHKAVEDAVRLSEEKYCSVAAMLRKTAQLTMRYEIRA